MCSAGGREERGLEEDPGESAVQVCAVRESSERKAEQVVQCNRENA